MNNPQAFPRPLAKIETFEGSECSSDQEGMTLLDYFSGKALMGLLGRVVMSKEDLCRDAYDYAEAMLKEREKRGM